MPDENRVLKSQEHIPYLANGLYNNWRNLWNKNATLAGKRKNPLILFHGDKDPTKTHQDPDHPTDASKTLPGMAGDTVVLPDPATKVAGGAVDTHNPFTTQSDKVFLRLRVLDEDFQPFKDANWMVYVDGIKYPKGVAEAKFEAGGMINLEVPKTAQVGKLVVKFPVPPEPATPAAPADGSGQAPPASKPPASESQPAGTRWVEVTFMLQIGRLDPIQEDAPDDKCFSGVQQRLNNLGLEAGIVDGVGGPHCEAAIKRFQRKYLTNNVNGTSDAATQAKLHELHDTPAAPPKPGQSGGDGGSAQQPQPPASQPAQPGSSASTTPSKIELVKAREAVAEAEARHQQALKEAVDAAKANRNAQNAKDVAFEKWKNDRNNKALKEDYESKREQAVKTEATEAHARKKLDRAKKDVDGAKARKQSLEGQSS